MGASGVVKRGGEHVTVERGLLPLNLQDELYFAKRTEKKTGRVPLGTHGFVMLGPRKWAKIVFENFQEVSKSFYKIRNEYIKMAEHPGASNYRNLLSVSRWSSPEVLLCFYILYPILVELTRMNFFISIILSWFGNYQNVLLYFILVTICCLSSGRTGLC